MCLIWDGTAWHYYVLEKGCNAKLDMAHLAGAATMREAATKPLQPHTTASEAGRNATVTITIGVHVESQDRPEQMFFRG